MCSILESHRPGPLLGLPGLTGAQTNKSRVLTAFGMSGDSVGANDQAVIVVS